MEPVLTKPRFEHVDGDSMFFATEILDSRPGENELRKYQQLFQEYTKSFQTRAGRKSCAITYMSVVVDSEGIWMIARFYENKQTCHAKGRTEEYAPVPR